MSSKKTFTADFSKEDFSGYVDGQRDVFHRVDLVIPVEGGRMGTHKTVSGDLTPAPEGRVWVPCTGLDGAELGEALETEGGQEALRALTRAYEEGGVLWSHENRFEEFLEAAKIREFTTAHKLLCGDRSGMEVYFDDYDRFFDEEGGFIGPEDEFHALIREEAEIIADMIYDSCDLEDLRTVIEAEVLQYGAERVV